MPTLSLYLDTSVIGGYYDDEFMKDTRQLWRLRDAGQFRFVTSLVALDEIAGAPEPVRELARATFSPSEILNRTTEAEALAQAYLKQDVVSSKYIDDARHVALCTIGRLDYLVSWKFKHLANARREAGFNAVNLLQGYSILRIVAPTFLIYGHEEKAL